jgi:hypothetical protein
VAAGTFSASAPLHQQEEQKSWDDAHQLSVASL